MDHIAIMRKSWGLLPKILSGEKTIESRWYKARCVPWDRVRKGDTIYFKNSGEPITARAKVAKVVQFSDLTPVKVREILRQYGTSDGLGIIELGKYYRMFKDKKYCLLVFLKNPRKVEPFAIDKTGYGLMAAWLVTDDIEKIKE